MKLAHATDAVAACTVNRDDGLGAQLKLISDVDDPRIDRAGGSLFAVEIIGLGLQVPFN